MILNTNSKLSTAHIEFDYLSRWYNIFDKKTSTKYLEIAKLAVTQCIDCKTLSNLFYANSFSPVHGIINDQKYLLTSSRYQKIFSDAQLDT